MNALYELEKNEEHPLYPFIASWNSRFVSLARSDFSEIREFRRMILQELKRWMCPEDPTDGKYYEGLVRLQEKLNFPLHLFSLNYDLAVERVGSDSFRIESGFSDFGPTHVWDWERFESGEGGPSDPPEAFLYKLHGSINWKRDNDQNLFSVEQIENVDADKMEVIFGRDFKLEAADPYLFFAYQFRRLTFLAKLIVTIGYSFADEHINKMIIQALRNDSEARLCIVSRVVDDIEGVRKKEEVSNVLQINSEKVIVLTGAARSFLEAEDIGDSILGLIPSPAGAPF